jgi:hypothetical protein
MAGQCHCNKMLHTLDFALCFGVTILHTGTERAFGTSSEGHEQKMGEVLNEQGCAGGGDARSFDVGCGM